VNPCQSYLSSCNLSTYFLGRGNEVIIMKMLDEAAAAEGPPAR
jgi:hypothetical protein